MSSQLPQKGQIYRHFKHDPNGNPNNFTYEIVGTSVHSETGEVMIAYKPLYHNEWLASKGGEFFVRPLEMFTDTKEVDGEMVQRFTLLG